MEIKYFSILAPRQCFCCWKKSYAHEGTRKREEMKKGNIGRSQENMLKGKRPKNTKTSVRREVVEQIKKTVSISTALPITCR